MGNPQDDRFFPNFIDLQRRYLKHEIAAPPDHHGKAGRFTAVVWHPEDALKLILTTQCKLFLHFNESTMVYSWYPYVSLL